MSVQKQILTRMLDELPEEKVSDVISYVTFIKNEDRNQNFRDFEKASLSSMGFWNNSIDDEVWNDA